MILSRSASESGETEKDTSEREHLLEDVEPVSIDNESRSKSADEVMNYKHLCYAFLFIYI
jgi:hypothetical protein